MQTNKQFKNVKATANWDVAKNTAFSPVSPTALTEVARLRKVVIIVVTERGVRRITPWALQNLVVRVVLQPQPPVPTTPKKLAPSSPTFIVSRDGSKWNEQSSILIQSTTSVPQILVAKIRCENGEPNNNRLLQMYREIK
ncbi:Uncharacterized protein Fot_01614 [Forsythia ovata]|uniref:Uncharacterized protein n=1 Tax=Forsythia ovata TaxID=205694 RepID=A0ABD1X4H3_9LAMI